MKIARHFKSIGPGILIAATGVGAGDMITAAVGGANYSYVILWSVMIGAMLKYVLNEGIARWQISSGQSMTEAWLLHFPSWVSYYFLIYLILWTFIVGAALSGATGMAAHAIFPALSVSTWAIIQAIVAFLVVRFFRFQIFENIMKILISFMFTVVIVTAVAIQPDFGVISIGLFIPNIPKGSVWMILGIVGGVGGSLTLLSYGYWIREKNWSKPRHFKRIKLDLGVAYLLTGIFGLAAMIIAAQLKPEVMSGNQMVLSLAEKVGERMGLLGKWMFLLGFWGAVFSSMLGVWQGIPYLFADFMQTRKTIKAPTTKEHDSLEKGNYYLYFQIFLVFVPLSMLFFQKPVWIIMVYAVVGGLFMPFLAVSILYLNNRKITQLKNNSVINVLLVIILLLFGVLLGNKIFDLV